MARKGICMGNEEESRRSGEMDAIEKGGEKVEGTTQQTQPNAGSSEQSIKKKLKDLMTDWRETIKGKEKIKFSDDEKEYFAEEYFCSDGFYPGYFSTENKTKILFIGREARYASQKDRVESDIESFKEDVKCVNASSYWRRILYIAYGIANEGCIYSDVPYASEILNEFLENDRFNFAIMNISKYSNDSKNGGKSNWSLINRFLKDSDLNIRNFIREEIELLEPDLIITANLFNGKIDRTELEKVFSLTRCDSIVGKVDLYKVTIKNRTIKLMDTYHFSKPGSDKTLYYEPVMELYKKYFHSEDSIRS